MMVEMEPTAPTPPSRDGTRLLAPAFPGDTGAPDAVLRAALAAAAAVGTGSASGREALALLQGSRVLVPVMAVLGESESDEHGTTREKSSDMAAVLMTGADGRRALLAFTGADSLEAWDAAARPVPVTVGTAARAALQEGAAAVVLDLAGPASFVVQGEDLDALAAGWHLARAGERWVWLGSAPDSPEGA